LEIKNQLFRFHLKLNKITQKARELQEVKAPTEVRELKNLESLAHQET
jgi:hypothetical protein